MRLSISTIAIVCNFGVTSMQFVLYAIPAMMNMMSFNIKCNCKGHFSNCMGMLN